MKLAINKGNRKLPVWARFFLFKCLARVVLVKVPDNSILHGGESDISDLSPGRCQCKQQGKSQGRKEQVYPGLQQDRNAGKMILHETDWYMAAKVVDRLAAAIFLIVHVVILCFAVWSHRK